MLIQYSDDNVWLIMNISGKNTNENLCNIKLNEVRSCSVMLCWSNNSMLLMGTTTHQPFNLFDRACVVVGGAERRVRAGGGRRADASWGHGEGRSNIINLGL